MTRPANGAFLLTWKASTTARLLEIYYLQIILWSYCIFKIEDKIRYLVNDSLGGSSIYCYGIIVRQDPAGYSNGADCWIVKRLDKTRFASSPNQIELCDDIDQLLYF